MKGAMGAVSRSIVCLGGHKMRRMSVRKLEIVLLILVSVLFCNQTGCSRAGQYSTSAMKEHFAKNREVYEELVRSAKAESS